MSADSLIKVAEGKIPIGSAFGFPKEEVSNQGYLLIANLTDDQIYEISDLIDTDLEHYNGSYKNVVMVSAKGIKFNFKEDK